MRPAQHTTPLPAWRAIIVAFSLAALVPAVPCLAQARPAETAQPAVPVATYADMAALTERASIVALVEVRKQAQVEPARAPGLAPGHTRLYVTARTSALLAARSPIGESLNYLVDIPLDTKGRAPKLKKQRFLIFAAPVPGSPGVLQLVGDGAQVPATLESEQLARTVIAAFAEADAPPKITGVRDIMSVAGNLVGESETQLFLDTSTGEPVSLSVIRRPGMEPRWGVSWSEIVDQSARPPAPDSVEWYRLACTLPAQLPSDSYLQGDPAARDRAKRDYGYILQQLGTCERLRT
ncbi:MAG: hypothetical protein ABIT16_05100 [Croceibacterium sp.]